MSGTVLTARLRLTACTLWSLGLALIGFDFLSLPVLEWRASVSYVTFLLAALTTLWAEKREFGTRVTLYRLHDAVIFSPWKFLLLYFLWISVFSPFTSRPQASLLYAVNGWLSLFTVGITAQFVFSERTVSGIALLPSRLALAFYSYCFTVSLLLANFLLHLIFPSTAAPMLVNEQANLFLYFSMGLPFLLWDLLKEGRRLVPRWLSALTILMGAVATLLINRHFYFLTLAATLGAIVGLFLYKRIRPRRALWVGALVVGWGMAAGLGLLLWLEREGLRAALDLERLAMAERMQSNFRLALEVVRQTNGLGGGLGVTGLRGVWTRVLAETGVVGFALYLAFFLNVLYDLFRVRRSSRVVVSNVSFVSVALFLGLLSHFVENPYGAYVWVWYALWALFASTPKKRAR